MKQLLIVAALAAVAVFDAGAQNYPDFYLRGDMTDGWNVQEQYKFSRSGDTYSLSVSNLTGSFKISNSDWTINYGANVQISSPVIVAGVQNGDNMSANNVRNVDISFKYVENAGKADIWFTVDGVAPTPPQPEVAWSNTLPVLFINVYDENGQYNNEVIDKNLDHKNYFAGEYWLDLNGCQWLEELGAASIGSKEEPLPLEIKARGNYTRKAFAKKPFKLKLGKKQKMLGLTNSKHFAILAHADDNKGYLRNFTGFNLGRRMGLPWTPWMQPVEVVINGDYRGLYFLTESIRVETDRVNIEELEDLETNPALCSGGYIVELDNYDEANQIQMDEKGTYWGPKDKLRITFDTPEEYSDIQRQFITHQFTAMNDLIGANSNDLWKYMDLDDAARYYVVEEIIGHTEAYHGSTYLFRDRGENQKWHFSPLWDCGNAFNGADNNWFYVNSPYGNTWIPSLRNNSKFNDKVAATWQWFMTHKFDGLYSDIDQFASRVKTAAEYDYKRWKDAPTPTNYEGPQGVVDNRDMTGRANEVKQYLQNKTNWLRQQWGSYGDSYIQEPERDATPAADLPEFIPSGICAPVVAEEVKDADIFDLRGMKVSAMTPGEVYILHRNGRYEKVIAE